MSKIQEEDFDEEEYFKNQSVNAPNNNRPSEVLYKEYIPAKYKE